MHCKEGLIWGAGSYWLERTSWDRRTWQRFWRIQSMPWHLPWIMKYFHVAFQHSLAEAVRSQGNGAVCLHLLSSRLLMLTAKGNKTGYFRSAAKSARVQRCSATQTVGNWDLTFVVGWRCWQGCLCALPFSKPRIAESQMGKTPHFVDDLTFELSLLQIIL